MPYPTWYLGLDFGTTGLSAVLSNADSKETLPLYWLSLFCHSRKRIIETLLSPDTILDLTLGNRLQKGSEFIVCP
jgi:hypothetical protein